MPSVIDMPEGDLGAKIDRLDRNMRKGFAAAKEEQDRQVDRLDKRIDRLDAKIEGVHDRLDAKIDGVHDRLDGKIERVHVGLDGKIERLGTEMRHLILGTFGATLVVVVGAIFGAALL